MALTASELAVVRSWVGDWETEADLNGRHDRLDDVDKVILESLRAHRATLLEQAATMTVEEISLSFGTNITELGKIIEKFEEVSGLGGTGSDSSGTGANVTTLHRERYR